MSTVRAKVLIRKFRLFDFVTADTTSPNGAHFEIQMFGLNERGETCSIVITDYQPFFYIRVGDTWNANQDLHAFADWIVTQLLSRNSGSGFSKPVTRNELMSQMNFSMVRQAKLYGFDQGRTYPFIKAEFTTVRLFNQMKNLWYSGDRSLKSHLTFRNHKLQLYESGIPPILRYFHIQNISPSGWVKLPMQPQPDTEDEDEDNKKKTTCHFEFRCTRGQVVPIPEKETLVPFKICSFDIEASSSHGDFPVPQKTYKRLATNLVDLVLRQPRENQNHIVLAPLLRCAIQTAFDSSLLSSPVENIDLVFPKRKCSDSVLDNLIRAFLEHQFDPSATDAQSRNQLMTVEDMFAAAAANMESPPEPNEEEEEEEEPAAAAAVRQTKKPKKQIAFSSLSRSVVDVLSDETLDRETKILLVNNLFSVLLPFPELEGDKVTFIGSTFMRYGEKEPYLNHCVVLGTCDTPLSQNSLTVTESVESEHDLLLRWRDIMAQENPDIIIGYNIFGFDYEFLFRRAQENYCTEEFLLLSRNVGEVCGKRDFTSKQITGIENTKVVLASGEYDLRFIKMTGRIQIDMYSYLRRDYNLPSYKLDDVAGQFIGDTISQCEIKTDVVTGQVQTFLRTKNTTGLHIGDFVRLEESGFTADYYAGGTKFVVEDVLDGSFIAISGHHVLDATKSLRWGLAKDDVTPQDIFRMTNEGPTARAVIAKYCIQDCNLVHHLMNKIDALTSLMEMSRICSVPISYLIFRGQGIKLTSYVAKKCREKNTLMPDLDKVQGGNEGYEGAIVLPPKCALYYDNPVACVDYASLYPSAMISENLSHDSKVWTKEYDLAGKLVMERGGTEYDDLPGYTYVDIEFDTFEYKRKNPSSKAEKIKKGIMVCRWAQFPDGRKGIMPSVLEELLRARADTRKQAKEERDAFMANILEKRQLGYKVTANSLYGQCGARTSSFYEKDIAASTTAMGRKMIIYAKRVIEEVYGDGAQVETTGGEMVLTNAKYVYGDSVAGYTPLYLRTPADGLVHILAVEEFLSYFRKWYQLPADIDWTFSADGKEVLDLIGVGVGVVVVVVETWSDSGWTRVECLIRHRLADDKKMVRIMCNGSGGIVDVTSDHSLLTPTGEQVKPRCLHEKQEEDSITVGGFLMTKQLVDSVDDDEKYFPVCDHDNDMARLCGFFAVCGEMDMFGWRLLHPQRQVLERYLRICRRLYAQEFPPSIQILQSVRGGNVCFSLEVRHLATSSNLPQLRNLVEGEYLSGAFASRELQLQYLRGVLDDHVNNNEKRHGGLSANFTIVANSQVFAAQILYLCRRCFTGQMFLYQDYRSSKLHKYCISNVTSRHPAEIVAVEEENKIFDMMVVPYYGYVYDLTTANHHFAAGAGNIIVHNTDSVFFTFNLCDPNTKEPIRGKRALGITIELAQQVAHLCTRFLKSPMELTYEKTLMPFALLAKKRYVGMLYETDTVRGKLKYMGLSLKRRDSCDYLKDVYGCIIKRLMAGESILAVVDFLQTSMVDLIEGKVPMEKLLLTRSLRSDYKNPQQIAHKVLADRMAQRDPGNKPKPGDRVKFVFIVNANPRALLGDRIETPEFVVSNRCQIDYAYYITNQLMKPLQQFFGLAVEEIASARGNKLIAFEYRREMKRILDEVGGSSSGGVVDLSLEVFMKKKEQYCARVIKTMLFDGILKRIQSERSGLRMIKDCFKLVSSSSNKRVKFN